MIENGRQKLLPTLDRVMNQNDILCQSEKGGIIGKCTQRPMITNTPVKQPRMKRVS